MPGEDNIDQAAQLVAEQGCWERAETDTGIPYYLNHTDGSTHWEHPDFTQVFVEIDGLNSIKYAAYRTAMKLRAIQKITHLDVVHLHIVKKAFAEFGLQAEQNAAVLTVVELRAVLSKIFQLAQRGRASFIDPDKCTELTLNWTLKCLDSGRTGSVKLRSLKIITTAMCSATLEEKYTNMFSEIHGEQAGLSRSTLKTLLQDMLLLPLNVSETGTFSQEIADPAVQCCWDTVQIEATALLNLEMFLGWITQEPIAIVWLPTLHRLATAETVKHEAKCATCKAFPIVGFRYRCLKCTNVDLCQSCFWTQRTTKNHKVAHPTKEYCLATTTGDDVRDFRKQLKNKITRKYRRQTPKKSYLEHPLSSRAEDDLPITSPVFQNVHTRVNLLAARLHELDGGQVDLQMQQAYLEQQKRTESRTSEAAEAAEMQARQMEGQIGELQQQNQQLQAEVVSVKKQLQQRPTEPRPKMIKVPVSVEASPITPAMRTQAVHAFPSEMSMSLSAPVSHTPHEWSSIFGGEDHEMEVMLTELLTSFPTRTADHEAVACDLDSELFKSVSAIGIALSKLVGDVASTQELS